MSAPVNDTPRPDLPPETAPQDAPRVIFTSEPFQVLPDPPPPARVPLPLSGLLLRLPPRARLPVLLIGAGVLAPLSPLLVMALLLLGPPLFIGVYVRRLFKVVADAP